jgi:electron transport complex protein RnfE
MQLTVIPDYDGFLLMILPPGAFLMLGFIVAGKRVLARRSAERASAMRPAGCG